MFTYEFQDTEPVNDQLIVKMTFHIIDRCGIEKGLHELVKGLVEIIGAEKRSDEGLKDLDVLDIEIRFCSADCLLVVK